MQNNAYQAYNASNISVESPQKLVLMLYEGVLRFISRAKKAIIENNIQDKVLYINKTSAIFM